MSATSVRTEGRGGPDTAASQGPYGRFLVHALATLALLAVLGWLPTERLAGADGLVAMVLALGVALVASLAGTLPIFLARDKPPAEAMPAQLGAMALRLAVVTALGCAVALASGLPLQPFLIWLAVAHAALLVADTFFARSFVADAARPGTLLEER